MASGKFTHSRHSEIRNPQILVKRKIHASGKRRNVIRSSCYHQHCLVISGAVLYSGLDLGIKRSISHLLYSSANTSNTSLLHLFLSLQISLIAHLLTAFPKHTVRLISNSISINTSINIRINISITNSISVSITSRLKAYLPSSLH